MLTAHMQGSDSGGGFEDDVSSQHITRRAQKIALKRFHKFRREMAKMSRIPSLR